MPAALIPPPGAVPYKFRDKRLRVTHIFQRMTSYDILGKFYDAVMGRAEAREQLQVPIRRANPNEKNELELACGTGSVLKRLSRHYQIRGLDLSRQMLSIARKRVPQARLSRQNRF